MKKLSIEEKAKAYDEAKARMSRAFNSNRCTIGFMNEIFPELCESEDEKIRKALIKYFTLSDDNADYQCCGVHCKDILAWLKKQDEQKPKQEWSEEDENEVAILEAYINSKEWSESHIDRALGIVDELVNKVKSIRPKSTWKPSAEQMEALKSSTYCQNEQMSKVLFGLYQDLKKLREE